MGRDTYSALCGQCRIPVEGPANPKPDDVFTCPRCKRSGKHKEVTASVKAFIEEAGGRHLQEHMRKTMRGNKLIKFTGQPIPKRNHRFIVDIKF